MSSTIVVNNSSAVGNLAPSKRRLSSSSEVPQFKRVQVLAEISNLQDEKSTAFKGPEKRSDVPDIKPPEKSLIMIDNDIEERIHRALEYLKTHPDPPCPPVSTRKLTKEEQREMNMINYGQPTRPGPDHETWKWQPDPDTGEWYYDEDLDGYAFHSPDWFEGNDQ